MSIGKGSIPFHRIKKVTDIGSGDGLAIRMFSLEHGLPVTGMDNESFLVLTDCVACDTKSYE